MRNQGKVGVRSFFKSICSYLPPGYLCCCSLLIIILQSAFTLLLPFAIMKFIDRLKENQRDVRYLVLIAVLFLLQLVISAVMLYAMTYLSQYIMKGVRNGLWDHILELPVEYFDAHDSGEIMSRISNDTQVIKEFITTDLVSAVTGIITVVGSVFYLFWIDWRMTILMLAAIPVTVFAVSPVSRKVYDISKNTQDELAGFQKDLERVLSNVRLVKLSLAEQDEKKAGEEKIQKLFGLGLKEGRVLAVIQPFTTMVIFLLLVLIFGYGSIRVANHTLSAGGLVAIVYYLFQIVSPCTQMASFFAQLQKALGAYERILVILDRPSLVYSLIFYLKSTMENQSIVFPPRLYSICCFSTISLTTTPWLSRQGCIRSGCLHGLPCGYAQSSQISQDSVESVNVSNPCSFKKRATSVVSSSDRKSTRLNSSHTDISRMPSSA